MNELLTVVLGPLFFLPIMTGYYAYNHGRSFWRWFAIGCGLPCFSLFVVAGQCTATSTASGWPTKPASPPSPKSWPSYARFVPGRAHTYFSWLREVFREVDQV